MNITPPLIAPALKNSPGGGDFYGVKPTVKTLKLLVV